MAAKILDRRLTDIHNIVIHCNAQITSHGRNGNIREAESIFRRLPAKTVVSHTAMLTAYANNGQLANARKMFDEMPQRTVATWNAMITAYSRYTNRGSSEIDEAYRLFLRMPERNERSHAAMITGFVNAGRFDEAVRIYEGAPLKWRDPFCSNVLINGYLKAGRLENAVVIFEGMVEKDVVSWSLMVDGYCKNGRVSAARKLFDMMEENKNEFTWCVMIDGYMKAGCFEDGFRLFLRMRREGQVGIEPTVVTVIFESCGRTGKYREGCQVHGLVSRLGIRFDVFLSNSIIAMYSKFGCVNEARSLFDWMRKKDVVSWNSLLYGYVQAGRLEEAYALFEKAKHKDSASWTTLITGFFNKGMTAKCIELFNNMPWPDDIAWTALITGFVNNGEHEEAIRWFIRMLRSDIRPNPFTLSSLVSASANLAISTQSLQMHALVLKFHSENDLSIQNSVVSMYSKCGNVVDAYKIFKSITNPNIVSFNSMVMGFACNGYEEKALELFRELVDEGHDPNKVSFLGVLCACSHAGFVEVGWKYFRSMSTHFKVEPCADHYACMVDLLGRAGLLDEAMELILSMPCEPHSGVWGALLSASRVHMRLDLARLAAQHIIELEPNNAAPYVVLSDMYCFKGEKGDEEQMRLSKRLRGIKKSPGCSWITVKDKLTLFLSGDKSHVNFESIKTMLWIIVNEKSQLHSTEIDWSLH